MLRIFGDELHGRVAVAFPEQRNEEFEEPTVRLGSLTAEQPLHPIFDAADAFQESEIGAKLPENRNDSGALDRLVLERIMLRGVQ